ncbi:hypothetical protein [Stappia sp. ES.058]|uniref:hypothetical protein n=1 Tax=Stappia sp. ES.058 TaxID=1881061 RepID=UPI00087B5018|nr:hypothetical protein [Stappia sp. ES.058]SDU28528.1 hypothetical protein SAMN05428979_2742 [Stappia sp. ES.058]
MRLPRRSTFSAAPHWASDSGEDRDHTALHLAAAVALGLLFAASLTLFGGPLADGLKDLAPNPAGQVQSIDPANL